MQLLLSHIVDSLYRSRIGLKMCCRIADSLNRHFAKAQTRLIHMLSPDLRILRGPFKGMIYPNSPAITSVTVPKFIGAYEQELHPVLEHCFVSHRYATIINIGCGEGYYAVGCALRAPTANVIAYDMSLDLGEKCKTTALANKVENRVKVFGACSPNTLSHIPDSGRILILCDCEGAELDLLKPEHLPFTRYDILVETHDQPPSDTIVRSLHERFAGTHKVTLITGKDRDPAFYPELTPLSSGERWLALAEFRPFHMTWLWIEANE